MCSEYIAAEQIPQHPDKHLLKVLVTNTDCTSDIKSQYTYLEVTFASSVDVLFAALKINFLKTENI